MRWTASLGAVRIEHDYDLSRVTIWRQRADCEEPERWEVRMEPRA